ncbi:MAG: GH116 family glycosyl hydrolase [bacterium]
MRRIFAFIFLFSFLFSEIGSPGLASQTIKGKSIKNHSLKLKKKNFSIVQDTIINVGFLGLKPYDKSSPAVRKAFDYLKNEKKVRAEFLTFHEVSKSKLSPNRYHVLWIHHPDSTTLAMGENMAKAIPVVKRYLNQGGNLFLTQQAFHFINLLGLESEIPTDSSKSSVDDGYGRRLGFHVFREHPLFAGMNGGAYILRAGRDMTTRITGFFGDQVPKNGKVVGVDWDYIFVREDSKLLLEYEAGKGRVIAVGGYIDFTEPNLNRLHLELFTRNCLAYISGKNKKSEKYYWDYEKNIVTEGSTGPSTINPGVNIRKGSRWKLAEDEMTLRKRYASGDYYDVAGERMLVMGRENSGIEEVWAHPFMAFRDFEAGIRFAYRDTIYQLSDERPELEVHPGFVVRLYKFPRAYLKEVIVCDPAEPGCVVHYEYNGVYDAELFIRFKSNMRWMWPYSERVTGRITHRWDTTLNAFVFQDKSKDLNVILGSARKPSGWISGQFENISFGKRGEKLAGVPTALFQAMGAMSFPLSATDILDIVFSSTSEGIEKTCNTYSGILSDPARVLENNAAAVSRLFSNNLLITTPDINFNKGYRWALFGTDRFMVRTPGMGTALVAGYSTTRRGWDGGQKINGRPGYGWYFGRDGVWSGLALNDYGDYDNVKKELRFFNKYQDLTGKIFHEATTSGFIHYDASDATPLYILLAGRYFRYSNDTTFIRETWPNIKKAINFCFSTDTDQDHLIENTNVGHGWVEGGELYGSHSTLYMAGCWASALSEAKNMAQFIRDPDAEGYGRESDLIKKIINTDFWNEKGQFYSYGKNRDGSYRHDPTVLPAVPIYFKLADKEKASQVLKQYSSNAFTTNWGTRIVRDDSPYFNPRGYHYGSVWPLFTGWTALAEYSYGNYNQGFSHLMNNLNVYKSWGLGYVEEVLNGSEYQPSGVCPHQCWSETMVLQPALEGMLGLDIHAQQNRVSFSPRIPAIWDSLRVEHIRIGDKKIDYSYWREGRNYHYRFSIKGTPVEVDFMPVFPAGTVVEQALMDENDLVFTSFSTRQYSAILVQFQLGNEVRIDLKADKGISVIPIVPDPKPGYPAAGMRIITTNLTGKEYSVELEGKPHSDEKIQVYCNNQEIDRVENGRFLGRKGPVMDIGVDFPVTNEKYSRTTVRIILK